MLISYSGYNKISISRIEEQNLTLKKENELLNKYVDHLIEALGESETITTEKSLVMRAENKILNNYVNNLTGELSDLEIIIKKYKKIIKTYENDLTRLCKLYNIAADNAYNLGIRQQFTFRSKLGIEE